MGNGTRGRSSLYEVSLVKRKLLFYFLFVLLAFASLTYAWTGSHTMDSVAGNGAIIFGSLIGIALQFWMVFVFLFIIIVVCKVFGIIPRAGA